jgi:hypothetical protein
MVLTEQQLNGSKKNSGKSEVSLARKERRRLKKLERTKKQIKLVEAKLAKLLQPMQACERKMHSQFFDEKTFLDAFILELSYAKAFVLIQSPFITPHRVSQYLDALLDCIRRGVTVCVFIEDREGTDEQLKQTRDAAKMLEKIGVHVNFKIGIHEKILVVDGSVLWKGSLNILSFNGRKSEEIERRVDEGLAWSETFRFKLHICAFCVRNSDRKQMFLPGPIDQQTKGFGRQLEAIREQKLSIRQLGKLSGLSKTLIQELEAGERNVGIFNILEMCVWIEAELALIPQPLIPTVAKLLSEWRARDYPKSLPVPDASTRFMPKKR